MATMPIEIIVQDAEAPVVPSEDGTNNTNINTETTTVAVPDTGGGDSNIFTGSASTIVLPVVALVLALGTIVAIFIHKYCKQNKAKTSKKEKLAAAASSTIAILAATVLVSNLILPATKAATSDVADGIVPAEDKVSIVVTRDGGSAETSIESKATITSTSDFGYKVLLSMAEGAETSNLYLDGNVDSEYFIAPVEAGENTELADNTWGYTLEEDGTYSAAPLLANAVMVAQGDEPVVDEELSIYYGVKVSSDLPAGTYSGGEIEYNLVSLEPTISDLIYMQDFAKLSESGKTSVLTSMAEGEQYTLKDSRDQKEYFVSKLADGNVWMTQNLDLDIKSDGSVIYDSSNTDLPINTAWEPSAATRTSDDTTWGNSNTTPESYDPGDLYWNGSIDTSHDGALSNRTVSDPSATSGGIHYHTGNYYNWTAAVAMSDSSSYTSEGTDVDQSICPAGWRLPNLSDNKSYQNLVDRQSLTSGTSGNIQNTPTYFVYGGDWSGNSSAVGFAGGYWSAVSRLSSSSYRLSFFSFGSLDSQTGTSRNSGYSLRCVIR